jgi:hypothetical protein
MVEVYHLHPPEFSLEFFSRAKALPLANPTNSKEEKWSLECTPVRQLLALHYNPVYMVTKTPLIRGLSSSPTTVI